MVHVQCWAHKLNIEASLWGSCLPELNTSQAQLHNIFDGKNILKMTQKLFHEYLPHILEYVNEIEDGGSAALYFTALDIEQVAVIQCSTQFLLEHCSALVECIVELEGSTCQLMHKISSKVSDLKDTFLLVSRGTVSELTRLRISNLKSAVKQCGCETRILKSWTAVPHQRVQKQLVISSVGKLFDPGNIVNKIVDSSLYPIVKIVPLLDQVQERKFIEVYHLFQKQVEAILQEERKVDVLQVLNGLKERHCEVAECAISALWIPPSNVDSE
ncbi:hypothetical protein PR048_020697 [Dryococelus australis]|uniref:Uncharacterized protein n=1 Tax=Dryococelus australis TaxID=614101 RepID=A0ABQ9H703_9NEOP|nr:hypothetical protein PR048_020697 [Dryococelus australis]